MSSALRIRARWTTAALQVETVEVVGHPLRGKRGHSTTLRSALGIVMFPSLLSNGGRSQPVEWAA